MKLAGQKRNIIIMIILLIAVLTVPALAQEKPKDFPSRPVTIVVGFGAGGGTDIFARMIAIRARRIMKNAIPIINKPGSSTIIAQSYVQSQPADGYTVLATGLPFMITPGLTGLTKLQYSDWDYILRAQYDTTFAHVLTGGKYKNIQDVIADAKARPGKQTWTIIGPPSGDDAIRVKQFIEPLGLKVKLISYESAGKAHVALLGQHVDVLTEEVGPVSSLLEAKKITPVMVFSEKRLGEYPEVPTTKEMGADAFMGPTRGLLVKKGTPKPIIQYLHDVFKQSMDHSLYKNYAKANHLDLRPGYLGPEDCLKWLEKQSEFYTKVYKEAGILKIKK